MINKGLHSAERVQGERTRAVLEEYARTVAAHVDAFSGSARVYWRRTLTTHYRRVGQPPLAAWACRSPERLRCLNGVADAVLETRPNVRVVDDWGLAAARPDCTKDNRHYDRDNCGEAMAALFLERLVVDGPG